MPFWGFPEIYVLHNIESYLPTRYYKIGVMLKCIQIQRQWAVFRMLYGAISFWGDMVKRIFAMS